MIKFAAIMTAQRLYETLRLLDELDQTLGLQKVLESTRNALENLVNAPANTQHQSTLATSIEAFASAAAKLREAITPSQSELIDGMGGREFFDPSIADKVKDSIARNAMTPSVARDFVKDLATRREQFMETVRSTLQGLANLRVAEASAQSNVADVAFLIPRNLFDNQLGKFSKELSFINSMIRDFSEAATGQAEPVELQELSSSVPTVALVAGVLVLDAVARTVNKFLDAWKKIEEIREIRERLAKIGLKGTALEELTQQISATVEKVVEESTTDLLAEFKGTAGRKNELSVALNQHLRRLFGQIERGLTVEFRAETKRDEQDEATKKALENVSTLSHRMRFPQVTNEPLLLTHGELLEGSVQGIKPTKKAAIRKSAKTDEHGQVKQQTEDDS